MQLTVDSRRPTRHCSCRSGSVASLPLPPAAECLYRWADQRDEVVIVPKLQTREEALTFLRGLGYEANERDWAMGHTITVASELIADDEIKVWRRIIYIAPA